MCNFLTWRQKKNSNPFYYLLLIGIGRESNELKRSGTIGNVYELRHIIYELRHVIALLTLTIPLNN